MSTNSGRIRAHGDIKQGKRDILSHATRSRLDEARSGALGHKTHDLSTNEFIQLHLIVYLSFLYLHLESCAFILSLDYIIL